MAARVGCLSTFSSCVFAVWSVCSNTNFQDAIVFSHKSSLHYFILFMSFYFFFPVAIT